MDRFQYYQRKIANKLILSKFIYSSNQKNLGLNRMIIAPLPPQKDPELSLFGLASYFPQFPSFVNPAHPREKKKVLQRLTITSRKKKVYSFLNFLVNKVLPFQLENKEYFPLRSPNGSISWLLQGCSFSNEVNYLFFKYPFPQNLFDLSIQLRAPNFSLTETIYYGRLFQLPVDLHSHDF